MNNILFGPILAAREVSNEIDSGKEYGLVISLSQLSVDAKKTLQWRKDYTEKFKSLSKLANMYLGILATNVPFVFRRRCRKCLDREKSLNET